MKEDYQKYIAEEVEENPELKRMINEEQEQYEKGLGMSTAELLKSLSPVNFE